MKKILITMFAILVLALSVSMASATLSVNETYSSSAPTFGDEDQVASNSNADDNDDEDIYDTAEITLTSTAAATISSISVSPASGFTQNDLNITITDSDQTLAANTAEDITFSGRIPEDLDAVSSSKLKAEAFKVATVTITLSDSSTASFDVYMQRKNMLVIKDLDISVDGDSKDYDDGDDVRDAKPGDKIEIELVAENKFDDKDDDVEIEDVEVTVEIDDSDLDVDEDDDLNDINADDTKTANLEFTVASEADDDTNDREIRLEGEDEHGARHGEMYILDFEVERKSHDIIIKSASISDSSVSCMRGENSISVKLLNIGKSDEDEVSLYITNDALDLKYEVEDLEIDEDDDYKKTITFCMSSTLIMFHFCLCLYFFSFYC